LPRHRVAFDVFHHHKKWASSDHPDRGEREPDKRAYQLIRRDADTSPEVQADRSRTHHATPTTSIPGERGATGRADTAQEPRTEKLGKFAKRLPAHQLASLQRHSRTALDAAFSKGEDDTTTIRGQAFSVELVWGNKLLMAASLKGNAVEGRRGNGGGAGRFLGPGRGAKIVPE